MKVVYIISTLENKGPVNVLYNTIKYLDRAKFEPTIITLSPEISNSRFNDFQDLGIEIIQMDQSRIQGLFFGVSKIKDILDKLKPDLIQANCFRSTIITGLFIKKYKKIVVIHNFPHEDYVMKFGIIRGYMMQYLTHFCLKRFDNRISVSESLKYKFYHKYRINSIAVRNGIDTEKFKSLKTNKSEIRRELRIAEQEKVFIYLDALIKIKDPETAIDGFLGAFQSSNLMLVVGGGKFLNDLKLKYGEFKNIRFIGMTDEPYKYLKASDYYISSSLSESFHLAVVEAIYSGLYVIISDIDAHREILSLDNSLGKLFKPENVNAIKNILTGLTFNQNDPEKCRTLVNSNLSAEIMSKNYQCVYFNIISGQ